MSEVIKAVEAAIRSELGAEVDWGKQQIVVVTGGEVTDTTTQSSGQAKLTFRVVVPPEYSSEEGYSVELRTQKWPPASFELFIAELTDAVLKRNISMDGIRIELSEGKATSNEISDYWATTTTTTAVTSTSRTTTTSGLRRLQELARRASPRRLVANSVVVTLWGAAGTLTDAKKLFAVNSGNCFFASAAVISGCGPGGMQIGKADGGGQWVAQPRINQTAYNPKVAKWNDILASLSTSLAFEKKLKEILGQSSNNRVSQLPPGWKIQPSVADVLQKQAWLSDTKKSNLTQVWNFPAVTGAGTITDVVVQTSAAGVNTAFMSIGAMLFFITVCFTFAGTKRLKKMKKKIYSIWIKDDPRQNPQIKPAPLQTPVRPHSCSDLGASFDAQIPSDHRPKRMFDLEVHPIVEDVIVDPPMQAISLPFDDTSSHGNDGAAMDDWTYQPEINFLSDAEATLPARPQSAQSAREWSFIEKEWDHSKVDDETLVRLTAGKIPTLPPRDIRSAPPGIRRSAGKTDDWGDMMAGFWEGSDTPRSGTTATPVSTRRPSLRASVTPPERGSRPGTPARTQKETFQPNVPFSQQPEKWVATPIRRETGLDADRAETPVTPLTPTLRTKRAQVPWDITTEDKSIETIYALFSPTAEVLPVQSMPGGLASHGPLTDKGMVFASPGSGIDDFADSLTLPHSIPDDTLQDRTGGSLLDQSDASLLFFDEMRHARDVLGANEGIPSVRATTPGAILDTGRSWQTGRSEGQSYWGDSQGLQTPQAFSTPITSGGDRLQVALDFTSASAPPNYVLSPTFAQQQSQSMVGISAERWAPTATPGRVHTPTIAPPELPRSPAFPSSLPSERRSDTGSSWQNMQERSPWGLQSPTGSSAPIMDPYHMTFAPVYQDPAQMSGLRDSATVDSRLDTSLHTVHADDAWRAQSPSSLGGAAAAWGGRDPTSPLTDIQSAVGRSPFNDSAGLSSTFSASPEVIQEARRWLPADRRIEVEASLWDAPRADVQELNFELPGHHPQALMFCQTVESAGERRDTGGYGYGQLPELGNLVPIGVGASWQSPTAAPTGPPRIPGLPQVLQDQLRPRGVAEEAEWHGTPPYSRPVPVRVPGLPDSLRVASPDSSSGLPRHLQLTGRSRVSEWGDDTGAYEWGGQGVAEYKVENSWGDTEAYNQIHGIRGRSVSPTGASTVTPSFTNFQKSNAPRTLPTFDLEAFNQYEHSFTQAVVAPPPMFYQTVGLSMDGLPREVPTLGGAVPRGLSTVPSLPQFPDMGNTRPGGMGPAGNWGSEGSVSGTYSGIPTARSWTNAAEDVWD